MGSFLAICFVEKNKNEYDEVDRLLEKYDFSLEIEPYEVSCKCGDPPDKKCGHCNGNGYFVSKKNKYGKYSYYTVGPDCSWGEEYDGQLIPHAYITPDGAWYGKGHDTDNRTWKKQWFDAKEKYSNFKFMLVECNV